MATGSPSDVADLVVSLASSRPPALGRTRLVCVDGPSGSGKTTLGSAIAALTGAQVVHADDLMSGWRGLAAVSTQLASLVGPLALGQDSSYEHFNWHLDRYDRRVPVPAADWLVVEGVGSGAASIASCVCVLVWVSAADELRFSRGMARDGWAMEAQWRQFMVDERALFAREGSEARADVLVDGTGASAPLVVRP